MTSTIILGRTPEPPSAAERGWLDAQHWATSLRAYELRLPATLTADDVTNWLATVAATTHPARWSFLPLPPVGLDVVATPRGIAHYLLVAENAQAKMLAGLRAALPGVRITEAADYLKTRPRFLVAAEAALTSHVRPLALDRADGANAALLAALQPIPPGCEVRLSWTLTSAGTPRPVPSKPRAGQELPWWLENDAPADADAVRAERIKQRDPLLRAVTRVGVAAPSKAQAYKLFGRVWPALHAGNAPGVRVVRRWLPSSLVAARLNTRRFPVTRWPVLANVRELAGLLAVPVGGVQLPGLSLGAARQLPPAPTMVSRGAIVGVSNYPGMDGRALALKVSDRLRHLHLIGPTGTGKSTLIANLALQDIAAGYGVVLVDAKGDLVADVLARIPEARADNVVLVDPSATARPIGFNPLAVASQSDYARELIADHVLAIFHSIYREFWGPRTDEILRATLFSLTHTKAPDGSRFTIIEAAELLTNVSLRRYVAEHPSLPDHLRDFWQWFDGSLTDGERAQAVGPVLNKLRAFAMREPVRLLLGQSEGVKLDYRFCRNGILLVNLAKGKLGAETASLVGSLIVSSLWQAVLARVHVPADRRRPMFAYLDEFQDVIRLGAGNDLADMLAQARGMGLSLCLAHQYLNQLPDNIQSAVLGTVRTAVAFQLEHDDARRLAERFVPLTRDDLGGLATFEFAMRPCVDGQTRTPVTGVTRPLDAPLRDHDELAARSRERYGVPRQDVERAMRARLQSGTPEGFGRQRRRGGRS